MVYTQTEPWKILLIDDDREDFYLTQEMLIQAQGHKISLDWAATREQGKQKLLETPYDAVLVDYDLGCQSGIELIRELCAENCKPPLILYSGRASYEVDLEALEAGATMYLTKSEANPLLIERILRYAIERKQAAQCLAHSEQRSQALAAAAFEGIGLTENGHILDVNEQLCQMFGYQVEELNGKEIASLIAPEDRERVIANILQQNEGVISHTAIRKDGSRITVEAQAKMITYENRCVRVTAIRDVTEQHKMLQALHESEERYSSIFNNPHTPMLLIDPVTGQIVDANPAACALYGWTKAQITQMMISDINALSPEQVRQKMQQVQAAASHVEFIFPHRTAHGEIIKVDVHSSPITIGQKTYLFSIIHNLEPHLDGRARPPTP